MKLLSVKVIQPSGVAHTAAVKITDEVALDEIAVQNAIASVAGEYVSHQIIDTDKPQVMETIGKPEGDADGDLGPRVGVQHPDAVGIVDGQPSGAAPVDDDAHREDMGTLEGGADDRAPYVAPEVSDLDSKQGEDAFAGIADEEAGKPRRKK